MKTRTVLLNFLIQFFSYESYLEIGVYDNDFNFKHIRCKYKESCDPAPDAQAMFRMTSDDYFRQNKRKFDLIFIDGLHHSEQVIIDIANSLKCLNKGGTIVIHDCLPTTEEMQLIPWTTQGDWTGDTWKAFVHYRQMNKNLSMFTVDTDWGCGIIRKGRQELLVPGCEINYHNFNKNRRSWMNVVQTSELENALLKTETKDFPAAVISGLKYFGNLIASAGSKSMLSLHKSKR